MKKYALTACGVMTLSTAIAANLEIWGIVLRSA